MWQFKKKPSPSCSAIIIFFILSSLVTTTLHLTRSTVWDWLGYMRSLRVLMKIAWLTEGCRPGIQLILFSIIPILMMYTHTHTHTTFVLNRNTKTYPFIGLPLSLALCFGMAWGWRWHLWTVDKGTLISDLRPQCSETLSCVSLFPLLPECCSQWPPRRRKSQNLLQHPQNHRSQNAPRPRSLTQHQWR